MTKKPFQRTITPDFDLSRYAVCETWGAKEWAGALKARLRARIHWNVVCRDFDARGTDFLTAAQQAVSFLRDPEQFCATKPGPQTPAVRDQTVADLFYFRGLIDDPNSDNADWAEAYLNAPYFDEADYEGITLSEDEVVAREEICALADKAETMTPRDFLTRQQDFNPREFYLVVDLSAQNKQIISEFSAWLKKTRKKSKIDPIKKPPNHYTQDDFDKWHKDWILPVIDLTFWAETMRTALSSNSILHELNNIQRDTRWYGADSSYFRRMVQNRGEFLLDEGVIAALASQAEEEGSA